MKTLLALLALVAASMTVMAQDDCGTAAIATTGTISLPATTESEYWYSFTMPGEGKLQITSTSSENVYVYTGSCAILYEQSNGYENIIITTLSVGEEVYIKWSIGSGGNFEWNLSVSPFEPGDNCENAIAAEGANSLPATALQDYWYSYTMPSEGKLQLTSTSSEYVQLYSGTCTFLMSFVPKYENFTTTWLAAGEEVFIRWSTENGGNFDWNLNVAPFGPGDNCENAVKALDGSNSLSTTTINEYWYAYTMPSEGKLQITSASSSSVFVYNGTCAVYNYLDDGYEQLTVNTLSAGEEVFIRWSFYGDGNFDWDLSIIPFALGENCDNSDVALEGANLLPATSLQEYWYSYTMPSEGKLQIVSASSAYLNVYKGLCDNLNYQGWGYENLTLTTLSAGEEVFIQWVTSNGGDFVWNLSVSPLEPGDNCENAIAAVEGINTVPAATGSEYWYSFTMPIEGKLQITSASSVDVEIYSGTCGDLDWQGEGYENATVTTLMAGEEVYFLWNTYTGTSFDWNLSVAPFDPGSNCKNKVAAEEGANLLPATTDTEYWFSFTMPSEGKLQLTSTSAEYVEIFSGTCGDMDSQGDGYENAAVTTLAAGDDVIIRWSTYNGGNFEWELSVTPFDPGDNCENAVAATEGTNSLHATIGSEYWYSFTMPSDGKLQLLSGSDEFIHVYAGACNQLNHQKSGQIFLTVTTLSAGDEVLIKWTTHAGGNFNWGLVVTPFEPGDNCENADVATEGINSLPITTFMEYYWYAFTMPSEGKLQITTASSSRVSVYNGDCYDMDYQDGGYNYVTVTTLSEGDEVFIRWNTHNGGNFDWDLSIIPFEAGEKCENAVTAIEGENSIPGATGSDYWYSYTMPSEGKLQLTSSSSERVYVYTGSCNDLIGQSWSYDNLTIASLSSGDEVFIRWKTNGGGNFKWNLTVAPFEPGDKCSIAATASNGTNLLPATLNSDYWYSYTMPSEGKLQLTSSSSEWVSVYTGTCANLSIQMEDYESATVICLVSGDEILIHWSTVHGGGDFDWDLTVVPWQPGDNCVNAATAAEGINSMPATTMSEYWYGYTMPSAGKLQISSADDEYVTVYSGTCNDPEYERAMGGNLTMATLAAGDEVFIVWDTYSGGNFDWNLSVAPLEAGDICEMAVAAATGSNSISPVAGSEFWYSYTMPSEGKLKIVATDSEAFIYVYGGTCSNTKMLDGEWEDLEVSSLLEGDQIFIKMEIYSDNDFTWDISITPFEEGDNCIFAIPAVTGTNSLPVTSNNQYWYSYEMPSDGKLQITSDSDTYLSLYTGYCPNLNHQEYGYEDLTITSLSEGDLVYINWDTYMGSGFDWNIDVSPLEPGDNCALALVANTGNNTVPPKDDGEYWYSYTMPSDGKLQITSNASEQVTIFSGSCTQQGYQAAGYGNLSLSSIQSGSENVLVPASFSSLSAGDEVFIRWTLWGGGDFDWDISVIPVQTGDNCSMPAAATLGTNIVPTLHGGGSYWFSYTMPAEGGKLIVTNNSYDYVSVYTGTCTSMNFKKEDSGEFVVGNLSPGDQVLFWWDLYFKEGFEWELAISPLKEAEDCSVAVNAQEGINRVPEADVEEYWYKFIMPGDGKLEITSTSEAFVAVTKNSCEYANVVGFGEQNAAIGTLSQGDEVFIGWMELPGEAFDWNLAITDLESGDNCALAIPAEPGINTAPHTDYWFSYEVPASGNYTLTSLGSDYNDPYLSVYSDCGETLMARIDYDQTELNLSLIGGEMLYIVCGDWESNEGFSWAITQEGVVLQPQTITFNSLADKKLGEGDVELTAMASSELDVRFEVVNGPATITGNTVTFTGIGYVVIQAVQKGDGTYLPAPHVQRMFKVSADQHITFEPISDKSVDAAAFDVVATTTSGLLLSYAITGPASIDGTTVTLDGTEGTVIVTASQAGNEFYNPATAEVSFKVTTKTPQTISFTAVPEKTFGDPDFDLIATASSGLSVSFEVVSGPATISGSTVSITGAGEVTIKAVQAGDATYNSAFAQQTFTVKKADQQITVEAISEKIVSASPIDVIAATTSGLPLSYSVTGPATILDNTITLDGTPGTVHVIVSQEGNENYNAATTEISFLVKEKNAQDITFSIVPDKTYGDADFELTATASSGLVVTFMVVSGPATISGSTVNINGAGEVTIKAVQDGDATYQSTFVLQTFTVHKADQQITVEAISDKIISDPAFDVVASTSSGLALSYTISGPASITGNTITLDGSTGTVTVTVEQAGDEKYNPASTQLSFVVNEKNTQTITFSAIPDQFLEEGSLTLTATASSGLAVSFEVVSGPATVDGDVVTFTDLGTVIIQASQPGSTAYFPAEPVQQTLVVSSVTGIDDESNPGISIYPNPVHDQLVLDTHDRNIERLQLIHFDGRLVRTYDKNDRLLDFSSISPGLYLLRIGVQNRVYTRKIIKK